ncbi:DNA-binding domain-containing protein, AraC-type [Chryseobacterium populi]|uniref:DNA-binding domain-containing protein, AraC-type n=2 Tax=Chryseobacterium populi TaxID=1144316 RepID=J3CC84_9FLAO|nr:DNA-binding domain-containing protein, AraC-type [Chryseobacterium populi]
MYDLSGISQHGIVVESIDKRTKSPDDNLFDKGIHRDSHYIFTFLESGHVKMMVDFKIVETQEAAVFCVLPGQVHQGLMMKDVSGWFLGVKVDLVPDFVRYVFEECMVEIQPQKVDADRIEKLNTCAKMLQNYCTDEMLSSKEGFFIVQSLLNAYTGIFAHHFLNENKPESSKENRALQLTRQFRVLVRKEFKTLKSPSLYAEALHISPGYLTEVVRKITGKSALYWIQKEILVEAKRLLVFTNLTVKQIAHELGYTDHTYFTRLFSKLEGRSPSDFRDSSQK